MDTITVTQGSEKQIEWAQQIADLVCESVTANHAGAVAWMEDRGYRKDIEASREWPARLAQHTDARWWIDNFKGFSGWDNEIALAESMMGAVRFKRFAPWFS